MISQKTLNIELLLKQYNKDLKNKQLINYYLSTSIWDVLDKGRNETAHSAFLAWLLRDSNFVSSSKDSPIWGFFDIIFDRLSQQQIADYTDNPLIQLFRNGVLARSINFPDIHVETEKPVYDLVEDSTKKALVQKYKDSRGKSDSLDLYLKCSVSGIKGLDAVEVLLENKIMSGEGKPKEKTVDDYSSKNQTERYYWACKETPANCIRLFVFLKAMPSKDLDSIYSTKTWPCTCNNYICINYQDIYDGIIEPMLFESKLRERELFILNEYVRSLSMPMAFKDDIKDSLVKVDHEKIILATSKQERDQLNAYWIKNQKLLIAAIYATENIPKYDLAKHDWMRCEDSKGKLYSKSEVIQYVYDKYVSNKNAIFNRKRGSVLREIFCKAINLSEGDVFTRSGKPLPSNVDCIIQAIISSGALGILKEYGIEEDLMQGDDKVQIIEIVISAFDDILDKYFPVILREQFNAFKYKSKDRNMSFDVICDNDRVGECSKSKIDGIYSSIKHDCNVELAPYTIGLSELKYDVVYQSVLNDFWNNNKDLVMAAVRVLSESDNISADVKKSISEVYSGLTNRDWSTYTASFNGVQTDNLSKVRLVEWFIRTLLWPNRDGQIKDINEINALLKDKLCINKVVSDVAGKTYQPLHTWEGSESGYFYLKTGWTADGKNFKKVLEYMIESGEYTISIEE